MRTLTILFLTLSASASLSASAAQEIPASSPTVAALSFSGNTDVPEKELRSVIPFNEGDAIDEERLAFSRDALESLYRNRGFLQAKVTAKFDAWVSSAAVAFHVAEGRRWTYGTTTIEGLSLIRQSVVKRELPYKTGDPYDRQKLFYAQGRLYSLALFKDIRIAVSTTSAGLADVTIRLKEQPTRWIKGGVGYGSEEKERLSLVFTHNNFLRRAYKLELSSILSRIWLEYKVDLVDRYLFETETEGRATASWRQENRTGYDVRMIRGEASVGHKIGMLTRGTLRYRLEQDFVYNVDASIAAISNGLSRTSALAAIANRDTADDPFFPSRGTKTSLLVEHGGTYLGGTVNFNKIRADLSGYLRLFGPITGAATVHLGVAKPLQPSAELPIFERFFAGGANSVRGYVERGVGPRDAAGVPLGGEAVLGASGELRFPLVWRLAGAAFIDGAQAGPRGKAVYPSNWRHGAGFGIRFKTPVGPLRLDLGWKLEPDEFDKDPWRLHLSLGEAF